MSDKKSGKLVQIVKVASGVGAVASAGRQVSGSIGRIIKSFKSVSGIESPAEKDMHEYKKAQGDKVGAMIYSPFAFRYENEEGEIQTVETKEDIPVGAKNVMSGGYFFSDDKRDFAEMLDAVFTKEQRKKMISDASLLSTLYLIGTICFVLILLVLVAFGHWVALFNLPALILIAALSIKHGVYARTLRTGRFVTLSEFVRFWSHSEAS